MHKAFNAVSDFTAQYLRCLVDWFIGGLMGITAAYISIEDGATIEECTGAAMPVFLTYSFLFFVAAFALSELLDHLGIDKYLDRGESDEH